MPEELTIVLPIYDGMTQLDFTGPHQFFSRVPGAKVIVASVGAAPVASRGFTFSGLADLRRRDAAPMGGGAACGEPLSAAWLMARSACNEAVSPARGRRSARSHTPVGAAQAETSGVIP